MLESERALSGPFPIRAVIDSCVFPNTRRWLIPITQLAAGGFVLPIWSPLILAESNRVLTWLWIKRNGKETKDAAWNRCSAAAKFMFSQLTLYFRVVDDCPPQADLWKDSPPDEWDSPLWAAAQRSEAQFIVTSNLQDGPPEGADGVQEYAGIFMAHPDVFLTLIDRMVSHYAEASFLDSLPATAPVPSPEHADLYRAILAETYRDMRHSKR